MEMLNESDTHYGSWDLLNLSQNNLIFAMLVIACVLHIHIWSQIFIQKIKFDITFIFSAAYMSTDIFLILCGFIQYSIRIRSRISVTRYSCYFEAYSMFYFNLFESYCLTVLNICRYLQIVRNQNAYIIHRKKLILSGIIIPSVILINFIIQDIFAWCIVVDTLGASCTVIYTNIFIRIWNLVVILTTPILISFYMLIKALLFLKHTHDQQVMMRRNYHNKLIIDSFIFYSIWTILWSPWMYITFLNITGMNEIIIFVSLVMNTLEILADPIIAFFLDKRFAQAWKKFYQSTKHLFGYHTRARVNPISHIATPH